MACEAGEIYWADGDHWSRVGERYFGEIVVRHLEKSALLGGAADNGGSGLPSRMAD